jgi:hypothetical protein
MRPVLARQSVLGAVAGRHDAGFPATVSAGDRELLASDARFHGDKTDEVPSVNRWNRLIVASRGSIVRSTDPRQLLLALAG